MQHIPSLSSGNFAQNHDNLLNTGALSQSHLMLAQQVLASNENNIARTATGDSISFLKYVAPEDSSQRQTITSKNESQVYRIPSNAYIPQTTVKDLIKVSGVTEESQEV